MKSYQISIFGDVLHKGFRFNSMEKAYKYGIKGFVQYKLNSHLLIEAEGEEENLDAFIDWCKRGPIPGIVKSISLKEISVQNFTSFDIVQENVRRSGSTVQPMAVSARRPFFHHFFRSAVAQDSIMKKELGPVIIHL
jgi:acylphosphatase